MPELPEVEALVQDLRRRLTDRAIVRVDLAAFSALKTYAPPLSALSGTLVEDVTRHGKFLDITASGLHLVIHLSRAGWIRWRDEVPSLPPRPSSKSTLARRRPRRSPPWPPAPPSTTVQGWTSRRPARRSGWPSTSCSRRATCRAS